MKSSIAFSLVLVGLMGLLSQPAYAEEKAAPVPAPAPAATEPAKPETPKAAEPSKALDSKSTEKLRGTWKKMTPEQRAEVRKKAETRLNERYDRLKTAQQDNIKNILAEVFKLNKEERSILMAKIKQQVSKEHQQRMMMRDMEKKKEAGETKPEVKEAVEKKEAPAAEAPTPAAH